MITDQPFPLPDPSVPDPAADLASSGGGAEREGDLREVDEISAIALALLRALRVETMDPWNSPTCLPGERVRAGDPPMAYSRLTRTVRVNLAVRARMVEGLAEGTGAAMARQDQIRMLTEAPAIRLWRWRGSAGRFGSTTRSNPGSPTAAWGGGGSRGARTPASRTHPSRAPPPREIPPARKRRRPRPETRPAPRTRRRSGSRRLPTRTSRPMESRPRRRISSPNSTRISKTRTSSPASTGSRTKRAWRSSAATSRAASKGKHEPTEPRRRQNRRAEMIPPGAVDREAAPRRRLRPRPRQRTSPAGSEPGSKAPPARGYRTTPVTAHPRNRHPRRPATAATRREETSASSRYEDIRPTISEVSSDPSPSCHHPRGGETSVLGHSEIRRE